MLSHRIVVSGPDRDCGDGQAVERLEQFGIAGRIDGELYMVHDHYAPPAWYTQKGDCSLSIAQARQLTGYSARWLVRLVNDGKVHGVPLGEDYLLDPGSLSRYMRSVGK